MREGSARVGNDVSSEGVTTVPWATSQHHVGADKEEFGAEGWGKLIRTRTQPSTLNFRKGTRRTVRRLRRLTKRVSYCTVQVQNTQVAFALCYSHHTSIICYKWRPARCPQLMVNMAHSPLATPAERLGFLPTQKPTRLFHSEGKRSSSVPRRPLRRVTVASAISPSPLSRSSSDCFDILGLPSHADSKAIKSAYRQLARQYHPDVNRSDSAALSFIEVHSAYQVPCSSVLARIV